MAKRALIDPRVLPNRVAQVVPVGQDFAVAPPLYWVDCGDPILADRYTYAAGVFTPVPGPSLPPKTGVEFARVIHLNLNGDSGADWSVATSTDKFTRGLTLRSKSFLVADFVLNLTVSGAPLSPARQLVAKKLWSTIKSDPVVGLTGTDPAHLTSSEATRIEGDASMNFGLALG